jgi:integrase/recombinase XerD
MTEDMQVRNLSSHTQATYVQQVLLFARHFNKSPEILGPEEIRSYQVYLTNERKLAPSSIIIAVAALRFLYKITLHKNWNFEEVIPSPKKPQKLPIVLSPEEVLRFLSCVRSIKHRTILTTCYAAGLRVSEAVCLKVTDIDSERMVIRVQQGKGRKDRDVMLSPKLLEMLRDWWPLEKPKEWLFPGDRVESHIGRHTVEWACQKAHRRCRIPKPITPHCLEARICRSSAGIRHRRAHHPAAAWSSQPGYYGQVSVPRRHQGLLHQEPARSAPPNGWR